LWVIYNIQITPISLDKQHFCVLYLEKEDKKMGLNIYDKEKLMHDCKRINKGIKIIEDEKDEEKRHYIGGMLRDELDRLSADIDEMTVKKES